MGDIYLAGRNADYDLGLGDATQRNTHTQLTGAITHKGSGSPWQARRTWSVTIEEQ